MLCTVGPCVQDTGAGGRALAFMQTAWLEQELRCRVDRSETPFLIVAVDAPLYSEDGPSVDAAALRGTLEPLLLRHSVDAVLAGHAADFEVTLPLSFGQEDSCKGVVYVTSGMGSGAADGPVGFTALEALNATHFGISQVRARACGAVACADAV